MSGTPREDHSDRLSPLAGQEFAVAGKTLWEWRQQALQQAIAAGIATEEVDWLLQELAGLDRLTLRLASFKDRDRLTLTLPFVDLDRLWQQRLQNRVPVQYLTEVAPWRQFRLKVSPAVLIPRPETECVIDLAVAAANSPSPNPLTQGNWADLGTGSGAIALGLATAFPTATIHAVDCSREALAIAQANAQTYRLLDRIQFYHGSWFQPLAHLQHQFSGLISNPPYIPSQMVLELQPEVREHEPHLALDGGADGLDCVRYLIAAAPEYLQSGGIWLVELMAGQAAEVAELLNTQGSYHSIQIHPDLAGIDRFVLAYRI